MTGARLVAVLLLVSVSGCGLGGAGGSDERELTVLAAASLKDAFGELQDGFVAEEGVSVKISYASSTDLAHQAADGAPGDVLATADRTSMRLAEEAGVTGEVTELATNVLVVVTPPDNPAGVEGLDDLAGVTWVRCADEAPCGRVARAVLDAHGVAAEPASLEEDARATLDKVVSGEAEAGLVYASDAVAAGEGVATHRIPGADEQRTSYFTTTLEQSEEPGLARRWIEYVTSGEGRSALEDAGFGLP